MAFLIRRCMDVVRGLSRRLRSRDWLVLIHDGSSGSRSSGILCFCFIDETLETRGAAARRGASRGGRAGRSYTAAIARRRDGRKRTRKRRGPVKSSQTSESDDTGRFHMHLIRSQLSASPHAHWACPPLEQSMPRDRPPVQSLIVIHTAQSCATSPHGSVISAPRRTQRLHTQGLHTRGLRRCLSPSRRHPLSPHLMQHPRAAGPPSPRAAIASAMAER